MSSNKKLLNLSRDLISILDRDPVVAGIPTADADGRKVDVHSRGHTFAMLLSNAGGVPRMAPELMRHSPSVSRGADFDKLS